MPISPKEASQLKGHDIETIKQVEAEIDRYLKEKYYGGKILVPVKQDLHEKIKDKIEMDYLKAGWLVAEFTNNNKDFLLNDADPNPYNENYFNR